VEYNGDAEGKWEKEGGELEEDCIDESVNGFACLRSLAAEGGGEGAGEEGREGK
jgi:hypothetical protein